MEGSLHRVLIYSWTWAPEDTITQATSDYIKCKHWMCGKSKLPYSMYVTSFLEHWNILINLFWY